MYLVHYLGYSIAHAGLFSTIFDVGGSIGSPLLGMILDRKFKKNTLLGMWVCVSHLYVQLLFIVIHQIILLFFRLLWAQLVWGYFRWRLGLDLYITQCLCLLRVQRMGEVKTLFVCYCCKDWIGQKSDFVVDEIFKSFIFFSWFFASWISFNENGRGQWNDVWCCCYRYIRFHFV